MIKFKAIKPATVFKSSIFRETFHAAAADLAPKMTADMAKPTRTWSTPVVFKTEVTVGGARGGGKGRSGVAIEVTTDDMRYKFVDLGTKVRYATMSPDFQAKTKVNSLTARRGRGGLLFISKKRPRPGIKARGFTKLVQKKWEPAFKAAMERAMFEAALLSKYHID